MAVEVVADLMTLLVDSESWNEALYSGSLVDCLVDSRMVKERLAKMTMNTRLEGDQSA